MYLLDVNEDNFESLAADREYVWDDQVLENDLIIAIDQLMKCIISFRDYRQHESFSQEYHLVVSKSLEIYSPK